MIRTCDRGHASLDAANWRCPWCEIERLRAENDHLCSRVTELSAAADKVLVLRARIAELEKDAARIDAIERHLFSHRWNGVIDSGSRTCWDLVGSWRHVTKNMVGNTFREAIDAAMREEK